MFNVCHRALDPTTVLSMALAFQASGRFVHGWDLGTCPHNGHLRVSIMLRHVERGTWGGGETLHHILSHTNQKGQSFNMRAVKVFFD